MVPNYLLDSGFQNHYLADKYIFGTPVDSANQLTFEQPGSGIIAHA